MNQVILDFILLGVGCIIGYVLRVVQDFFDSRTESKKFDTAKIELRLQDVEGVLESELDEANHDTGKDIRPGDKRLGG